MSRTIKTEAIVLKKQELLHNDILLTLFTQVLGKIKVFAKGIKKITSRRLSHAQTGNLIKVLLHENRDYLYLSETKLVSGFSEIKKNQRKTNDLYFVLFIIDRLAPENQKEPLLYNILKKFLINLSRTAVSDRLILLKYLNKILIALGYLHKEKNLEELATIIEEIIHEKLPVFAI